MSMTMTNVALSADTGTTGCQISLSGKAEQIYISVGQKTYGWFADTTGSTGVTTAVGLTLSTNDVYPFAVYQPKYFYHVATGAGVCRILEVY